MIIPGEAMTIAGRFAGCALMVCAGRDGIIVIFKTSVQHQPAHRWKSLKDLNCIYRLKP